MRYQFYLSFIKYFNQMQFNNLLSVSAMLLILINITNSISIQFKDHFKDIKAHIRKMNLSQPNKKFINQLKQPSINQIKLFIGIPPTFSKQNQQYDHEDNQMIDESEQMGEQWRSNILISSTQSKQRTPFALKHLTSFQQKSMDTHGKRLSQAFKQYIFWVKSDTNVRDYLSQNISLSSLDWETVQQKINNQVNLTQQQKKTLISAARKNSQAQLIISELIQHIPEVYYTAVLFIASSLIQQFRNSKLKGKHQQQTLTYISKSFMLTAQRLYNRLFQLEVANKESKDHEKYFCFIKIWMQIFFLCLNGFLEIPNERRKALGESGNLLQSSLKRKRSANFS